MDGRTVHSGNALSVSAATDGAATDGAATFSMEFSHFEKKSSKD